MPAAPAAPPPAAPAAPAPKPAAPPPAPKPASPDRPTNVPPVDDDIKSGVIDAEKDFYEMEGEEPPAKPAKAAAPAPEGKDAKPDPDLEGGEPAPDPAAAGKTVDDMLSEEKAPSRVAELRTAYGELKKAIKAERTSATEKTTKLEARIKELEAMPTAAPVAEKLANAEKRVAELEDKLQFIDFQQSTEYQEKFQKPYTEAWGRALADFQRLKVRVPGEPDEDGQPTFTTRPANQNDLLQLANMDLSDLDRVAHEIFGPSAPRVIAHVEKIRELAAANDRAVEDAKKGGEARRKDQETKNSVRAATNNKIWNETRQELETKYPRMFAPITGDTQGNELLEKGQAEAARLFNVTAQNAFKTDEERVRAHAKMAAKIANHDRVVFWLKQARAQIKELQKSLAGFEQSEPPGGKAKPGKGEGAHRHWEDEVASELQAMDKRA